MPSGGVSGTGVSNVGVGSGVTAGDGAFAKTLRISSSDAIFEIGFLRGDDGPDGGDLPKPGTGGLLCPRLLESRGGLASLPNSSMAPAPSPGALLRIVIFLEIGVLAATSRPA